MEQLFSGTILLSALMYLGYQVKELPKLLYDQVKKRVIYTVTIEETSDMFNYLEVWMKKNFENKYRNVKVRLYNGNVLTSHYEDMFWIRFNGKRLWVSKGVEKFENAKDFHSAFFNKFTIYGVFAKNHIMEMLDEVVSYNASIRKKEPPTIYVSDNMGGWRWFGTARGKELSSIIIEGKDRIVDDISNFLSREGWYAKRGLPYKRSYMFSGRPGNGKSTLAIALAKHFDRDIYFLNFGDLDKDMSLINSFIGLASKSLLVLEDIDRIVGKNKKVSMSALLNCMDGALSKHGIITILTTNHPEKLDPALVREGRVDISLNVDNPSIKQVQEYLSVFYDQKVSLDSYPNDFPMTKIQEICMQNNLNDTMSILSK